MKDAQLQQIGQRIREVRLKAGILQGAIAEEFGCGQTRISAIEHGTRDPGVDFIIWFCERTGASADYILLGKTDEKSEGAIVGSHFDFAVEHAKKLMKHIAMSDDFVESIEEMIRKHSPVKVPECYWLTGDEQKIVTVLREHPGREKEFINCVAKLAGQMAEEG